MGQFSVEKPVLPGSTLSGNQQQQVRLIYYRLCKQLVASQPRVTAVVRALTRRVLPGVWFSTKLVGGPQL